ncbi:hypothetical protein EW145_g7456, partial [Phellinidium pouzarii]
DENGSWEGAAADWGDKSVGVIGVGSTTMQIVPTIQPKVKHLYNYVRGKAWLTPPLLFDKMSELLKRDPHSPDYAITDKEKEALKDPVVFARFRHQLESDLNSVHFMSIRGSEMQKTAQKAFKDHMIARLQKKPWIADHLMPDFSVTCRRLTPGPGYLEALCEDNTDFIPTHIKRITESGIELVDGTHHDLDVIICATGFDTSFHYPFTVIGRGGKTLRERYTPHPETYMSLCSDGFPNWFMSFGPNSAITTGALLSIMEHQVSYVVEAAKKMQREHLKSIEPKKEAVMEFDEYLEAYFKTTVFNEHCRSWYKRGNASGRNVGLWPGSTLHALRSLKYPRWEDYNFETLEGGHNRFYWLGDGSTHNEKYMDGDRAWYLDPKEIDVPPVVIEVNNVRAWPTAGPEVVLSEAKDRVKDRGWDNNARQALSVTVRAWIMHAFLIAGLQGDQVAAVQFYGNAIDVIRRGQKIRNDVPREDRGTIFDETSLLVSAHAVTSGTDPRFDLETMDSLASNLYKDTESAHEKIGSKVLSSQLWGDSAMLYWEAAQKFPEDDEYYCGESSFLFSKFWWMFDDVPVKKVLPLLAKLKEAAPKIKNIWEFSAFALEGRDKNMKKVLDFYEEIQEKLQSGKLTEDQTYNPRFQI